MRMKVLGLLVSTTFLTLATAAGAAIYAPSQQLQPTTISGFKTDPGELLRLYPNGGPELTNRVRDLVASDPTTLTLIVDFLKTATVTPQSRAIVTGLVAAAQLAAQTTANQPFGTEISDTVAKNASKDTADLYTALLGDVGTGAGAGGGGGGASTGGGGPTTSTGSATGGSGGGAQTFGASSRSNTGPSGGGTGFGGASTGASAAVSPQ